MKITAIYFTETSEVTPNDPLLGSGTVCVEVGGDDARHAHFDDTYMLRICTPQFIAREVERNGCFPVKNLLVVPKFENEVICRVIEDLLPRLSEFAERQI